MCIKIVTLQVNQKIQAFGEGARQTLNLMRKVLTLLPPTVNRLEKWESFLNNLNNENPVEIYRSIRLFRDQRNKFQDCSDSDTDTNNTTETVSPIRSLLLPSKDPNVIKIVQAEKRCPGFESWHLQNTFQA